MVQTKIEKLRGELRSLDFKPAPGIVVIKLFDPEAFNKSKLLLPQTEVKNISDVYSEMPFQGIVVAIGDEFVNDLGIKRPMFLKVKDHVCLSPDARNDTFIYGGEKYT